MGRRALPSRRTLPPRRGTPDRPHERTPDGAPGGARNPARVAAGRRTEGSAETLRRAALWLVALMVASVAAVYALQAALFALQRGASAAAGWAAGVVRGALLWAAVALPVAGIGLTLRWYRLRLYVRRHGDTAAAARARAEAPDGADNDDAEECMICLDDVPATLGVRCSGGHFVCDSCFSGSVLHTSRDAAVVRTRRNAFLCALATEGGGGCGARFSLREAATHVSDEALRAWRAAERSLVEGEVAHEHERELEAERARAVAGERERQAGGREVRIAVLRREITAAIDAATACPYADCGVAFLDYDACDALTCHACGRDFCALCLATCRSKDDAHEHVRRCTQNPTGRLFSGLFETRRRERIQRAVRGVLQGIEDARLRIDVAEAVREDLAQLAIFE